jgi:flagellar assembly protein FliH
VPLELYQALEHRCREIEARLPAVEKQARQAGFKEGEQAAQARWEKALEQATRAAAEIAALRPILRRRAEEDVVRLAMAIARRILRREATIDTDAVLGLLKAGLERIEQREVSQVRVRPDDVPTVSRYLERIGSPYRIEVVADSTLERGGMILETNKGSLDASLETQLEEIERGFTDLLKPR